MATDDKTKTPKNPYGGRPGGGISLPEYFRPTVSIRVAGPTTSR